MNKTLFRIKSTVGCGYRAVEKYLSDWNFRKRARYAYYYKHKKVKDKVILYEAFYGRGMLCNPYAIFLQLLDDEKFQGFRHVWVLDNLENHKDLIDSYKKYRNVTFVQFESKDYLKYLCSAKYLINNSTFLSYFTKKEDQVYLNTWHGIPLKAMGYDLPNGRTESANVVRNFLQTDYLLSANESMTDMYTKAYKLNNLYEGTIIEEGYPRLDILFRFDRNTLLSKFNMNNVLVAENKKVILYAPTWRGESFQNVDTDVECYYNFKKELEKYIDISKYQILVKVHQRVFELAKDKLQGGFFVPSTVDANEALALADILISDFSSIFFDFLATGRPVLFYLPDLNDYRENRGMYFDVDKLPGPYSASIKDLGNWINSIDAVKEQYKEQYEAMQIWSNTFRYDKTISRKIIDIIFNHNTDSYNIVKTEKKKKRILISKGRMQTNGITASMLSLLNEIDYNEFDVSVLILPTKRINELEMIGRINKEVRVLTRLSTGNCTILDESHQLYWERNNISNVNHPMHKREYLRCFGKADFDYVIDYDGYNIVLASLCLQVKHAKKLIWQHSDMMAEKELKYDWLERIFQTYKCFDKIVSCAYDVMLVNKEKLSYYCEPAKFTYMANFIDLIRINTNIDVDVLREYQGRDYLAVYEKKEFGCNTVKLIPYFGKQKNGNFYRFITMGRSSVEKNQLCLISAFSRLYKEFPNSCLYILGDGVLRKQLIQRVKDLNLEDNVIMPGNVNNPFVVMKNCDCFILPSLHEGQPLVINEARVLKMPIIVSNFSSVKSVLLENGQLVIGTSEQEIYEGMKAFIEGKVPAHYDFNAEEYNKKVYSEFLNVLND